MSESLLYNCLANLLHINYATNLQNNYKTNFHETSNLRSQKRHGNGYCVTSIKKNQDNKNILKRELLLSKWKKYLSNYFDRNKIFICKIN